MFTLPSGQYEKGKIVAQQWNSFVVAVNAYQLL